MNCSIHIVLTYVHCAYNISKNTVSQPSILEMKGLLFTFLTLLSFVNIGHGVLIGYSKIREDLEDQVIPGPQNPGKKSKPNPDNLYFDGLWPLLWLPMRRPNPEPKMNKVGIRFINLIKSKIWNEIRMTMARNHG